jgi:hypothetical protein
MKVFPKDIQIHGGSSVLLVVYLSIIVANYEYISIKINITNVTSYAHEEGNKNPHTIKYWNKILIHGTEKSSTLRTHVFC